MLMVEVVTGLEAGLDPVTADTAEEPEGEGVAPPLLELE